jgi:hypothetical protein
MCRSGITASVSDIPEGVRIDKLNNVGAAKEIALSQSRPLLYRAVHGRSGPSMFEHALHYLLSFPFLKVSIFGRCKYSTSADAVGPTDKPSSPLSDTIHF